MFPNIPPAVGQTDSDKSEIPIFKTWCQIQIGIGPRTIDGFAAELHKRNIRILPTARVLMQKTEIKPCTLVETLDLVLVTPQQLLLPETSTYDQILTRIYKLGLKLCPAEVGLQFWLQQTTLFNNDEYCLVGMLPVDVWGDSLIYQLAQSYTGQKEIRAYYGNKEIQLETDTTYCFAR